MGDRPSETLTATEKIKDRDEKYRRELGARSLALGLPDGIEKRLPGAESLAFKGKRHVKFYGEEGWQLAETFWTKASGGDLSVPSGGPESSHELRLLRTKIKELIKEQGARITADDAPTYLDLDVVLSPRYAVMLFLEQVMTRDAIEGHVVEIQGEGSKEPDTLVLPAVEFEGHTLKICVQKNPKQGMVVTPSEAKEDQPQL